MCRPKRSRSRGAFLHPSYLHGTKKSLQTNKGRRSAERRVLRDRGHAQAERRLYIALSRRAPLLANALAFRRSTAALARFSGLAQSGPALHGSGDVRYPGSQLLADRRRGRPGEFPNRPNTVCETAPGHRARSTFRIASGKRPADERAAALLLGAKELSRNIFEAASALIQQQFLKRDSHPSGSKEEI